MVEWEKIRRLLWVTVSVYCERGSSKRMPSFFPYSTINKRKRKQIKNVYVKTNEITALNYFPCWNFYITVSVRTPISFTISLKLTRNCILLWSIKIEILDAGPMPHHKFAGLSEDNQSSLSYPSIWSEYALIITMSGRNILTIMLTIL